MVEPLGELKAVSINDVKPYENNPRKNKKGVEAVANSLREFGWQQPIVVDADMTIIAGHTRMLAAKKLKLKTVPVVIAKGLSEEKVKAYRLADNKTGELTSWDDDLLRSELDEIMNVDMSEFGFNIEADEEDAPLYTEATDIQQYEPSNNKPELGELYDDKKFTELAEAIETADLPEETKKFLRLAAARHVKFDYAKIADYYANSDSKVQRLMEDSALVIIDYNDAIAKGYVKLKSELDSQQQEEAD